jgi:(p)ppGpp synthase/HD superfamily hydrolase
MDAMVAAEEHTMNEYEALTHAIHAHGDEKDKAGELYIEHPMAVAAALADKGSRFTVPALLHDVIEDTNYELEFGLDMDAERNVKLLTRYPTEQYAEYINKVCTSTVACYVKLADLWHNTLPEREWSGSERLRPRYDNAKARIWLALGTEWWPS